MFEALDPSGLLTEVEQSRLDESAVWAHRMAATAALLWQRTAEAEGHAAADPDADPGYALITGFVRTVAEVGPALNVAPATATTLVGYAEALDERLPQIFGLLASGRLDWESTKVIITRTDLVDTQPMIDLDRNLAAILCRWQCWSRSRLLNAIDKLIRTLDPDAAKQRRVKADTDRRIRFTSMPNGMARPSGSIPAPVAALADQRLTDMATAVCRHDPRTLDQRRVDAFATIARGSFTLGCACDRDDCPIPADHTSAGAPRFVINVVASAATLTATSEDPGYLDGYGVIDADQVRDIADTGALLRPTAPPNQHGTELLTHQPSAAVARWIRARHLTCSFPGCNRSAWRADLDHTVAFDHHNPLRGGWTMPANLDPTCRQHHRLTTFLPGDNGWNVHQLADGTTIWRSPTGRTYRSTPDGADLFGDIAAAYTPPPPRRRNHRRDTTRRKATTRAGMAATRAANTETRRINHARAHEIDQRQFRNNIRRMLLVLRGGHPTTNPRFAWANNPLENEHITADWQPPPPPPQPDDDQPPF